MPPTPLADLRPLYDFVQQTCVDEYGHLLPFGAMSRFEARSYAEALAKLREHGLIVIKEYRSCEAGGQVYARKERLAPWPAP